MLTGKEVAEMTNSVIEKLIEKNPEAVVIAGFDDCLIGTATQCGRNTVALYSTDLLIEELMTRGMDHEEAWEHYFLNLESVDMGENGPQLVSIPIGEVEEYEGD